MKCWQAFLRKKYMEKVKHQKNKSVTTCGAKLQNPQLFNFCIFFKIRFVEFQIQERVLQLNNII